MANTYNKQQRDRLYSLIVGTEQDAVEINNLQIKFEVVKTSSNKDNKNSAKVEIYNLSEDRRKALEQPYVQVSLSVGYAHTGLDSLFTGQIIGITSSRIKPFFSKKQGTDIITKLEIDEFYEPLNGNVVSSVVPRGGTVKDAIEKVSEKIEGLAHKEMSGENLKKRLPHGYPLSGTPRQCLDKISKDFDIEWQIDQSTLYVCDYDGSHQKTTDRVPSVGQMSGLIESPEFINEEAKRQRRDVEGKTPKYKTDKPNALQIKMLLNPTITAGGIIKLEWPEIGGFYKVDEVTHSGDFRGTDWYSTLKCTERVD